MWNDLFTEFVFKESAVKWEEADREIYGCGYAFRYGLHYFMFVREWKRTRLHYRKGKPARRSESRNLCGQLLAL